MTRRSDSIRYLRERKPLEKQLKDNSSQIANLKAVASKMGKGGFSDDLVQEAKACEKRRMELQSEIHAVALEIESIQATQNQDVQISESLKNFERIVHSLKPENQRELVQLMISRIVVKDRGKAERGEKNPEVLRSIKVEIYLRIRALLKNESDGRLCFPIDVDICKGSPLWARVREPLNMELRGPSVKTSEAQRNSVKIRHEIRKADEYAAEMKKRNWKYADLAEARGVTRSAVTQVMNWHKLQSNCRKILRKLDELALIRRASRKRCAPIFSLPGDNQEKALIKLLRLE